MANTICAVILLTLCIWQASALNCKVCVKYTTSKELPGLPDQDVECGQDKDVNVCPEAVPAENAAEGAEGAEKAKPVAYKCGVHSFKYTIKAKEGEEDTVFQVDDRRCVKNEPDRADACHEASDLDVNYMKKKYATIIGADPTVEGKTCLCSGDECDPDCAGPFSVSGFCVLWWMLGVGIGILVLLLIVIIIACIVCHKRSS